MPHIPPRNFSTAGTGYNTRSSPERFTAPSVHTNEFAMHERSSAAPGSTAFSGNSISRQQTRSTNPSTNLSEDFVGNNTQTHSTVDHRVYERAETRIGPQSLWNERKSKGYGPKLSELDVAALILNKQIGTGIFTTPGAVLLSTQSKGLSMALWTIGGFWTLMFLLIYLEFGETFPYNGGELVYLDEIYRSPQLLATMVFAGYFLLLQNSYGNAIQFAKHILLAVVPDLEDSTELDERLVRYIAISVITLVCLIHWHSCKAGLFLNKLLAWYKVSLLMAVFIAGMIWSGTNKSQWNNSTGERVTSNGMSGMVLIFYSYQGE